MLYEVITLNGDDDLLINIKNEINRITSYNVCYTKLLRHVDAPLDMRMSQEGLSAKEVINTYSYEQLSKIIFEFGEEKFARVITSYSIHYTKLYDINAVFKAGIRRCS